MSTSNLRRVRPPAALLFALLALACQEPTAPARQPADLEAVPERQDLAGLVDRTHWADGYLWAHSATSASYAPQAAASWNPSGAMRVLRFGPGSYQVRFSGFGTEIGSVGNNGHA